MTQRKAREGLGMTPSLGASVGLRAAVLLTTVVFPWTVVSSSETKIHHHRSDTPQRNHGQESLLYSNSAVDRLSRLPVLIEIRSPANGSTVVGPEIELDYTLRTARSNSVDVEGRALNHEEIQELSRDHGVSMCFELAGSFDPPTCSPLQRTTLVIKNALEGTWHTVRATLHGRKSGSSRSVIDADGEGRSGQGVRDTISNDIGDHMFSEAGDEVTVFAGLEGYDDLPMCGKSLCLDSSDARSTYFDHIYSRRNWLVNARSGTGSEVAATTTIRAGLAKVLHDYNVTSLLDAPCGDLTWMPLVDGIAHVRYTGADISPTLIEENINKFGQGDSHAPESESQHEEDGSRGAVEADGSRRKGLRDPSFVVADLVEGLPAAKDGEAFDLIFVRDMMLHLPPRHNLRVFQNVQESGARLFMASTYLSTDENFSADTFVPANGHEINLSKAPYCLRPPIALFDDLATGKPDQRMAMWELDPERPLILGGDCGRTVWS